MKEDEKWFLLELYKHCRNIYEYPHYPPERKTPRELINTEGFPMNYKRAWYLLEKWSGKGWYNYGVTLDLGWLEEEGAVVAERLIEEASNEK